MNYRTFYRIHIFDIIQSMYVCGIGSMKAKARTYIIWAGSGGPVVYGLVSWHLMSTLPMFIYVDMSISGGFFFNVCISQFFIHYLGERLHILVHPSRSLYVCAPTMVLICWLLDISWTVSTNFLVPWDCCRKYWTK